MNEMKLDRYARKPLLSIDRDHKYINVKKANRTARIFNALGLLFAGFMLALSLFGAQ